MFFGGGGSRSLTALQLIYFIYSFWRVFSRHFLFVWGFFFFFFWGGVGGVVFFAGERGLFVFYFNCLVLFFYKFYWEVIATNDNWHIWRFLLDLWNTSGQSCRSCDVQYSQCESLLYAVYIYVVMCRCMWVIGAVYFISQGGRKCSHSNHT